VNLFEECFLDKCPQIVFASFLLICYCEYAMCMLESLDVFHVSVVAVICLFATKCQLYKDARKYGPIRASRRIYSTLNDFLLWYK